MTLALLCQSVDQPWFSFEFAAAHAQSGGVVQRHGVASAASQTFSFSNKAEKVPSGSTVEENVRRLLGVSGNKIDGGAHKVN